MFARHHFLNMMAYMVVLSIFFLNFFDKYTVRISIGALVAAVLFDMTWLISESDVNLKIYRLIGIVTVKLNTQLCSQDS